MRKFFDEDMGFSDVKDYVQKQIRKDNSAIVAVIAVIGIVALIALVTVAIVKLVKKDDDLFDDFDDDDDGEFFVEDDVDFED